MSKVGELETTVECRLLARPHSDRFRPNTPSAAKALTAALAGTYCLLHMRNTILSTEFDPLPWPSDPATKAARLNT
jgi:hypothetical protein